MSGAVQVEQVRDLIQRLRSPAQMFYEYSADDGAQLRASAETLEALLSELATAQRERDAPRKAIHNAIGDFYFDEPDFDEAGGRTFRRVRVPKNVVREIVNAAIRQAKGGTDQ